MRFGRPVAVVFFAALSLIVSLSVGIASMPVSFTVDDDDKSFPRGMKWREIGPYRGGRSAAVTGIPQDRDTYYFGAAGGGVWKTTDAGRSWKNVSDGFFGGSIGAVAVSEHDPNVVWVGGGEKTVRGNVSHGDGIWRSTDAGRTWKHVGLGDSRHVSRIRVHPRDPDTAYVAAMGHLFGPNEERGVFRTRDGGRTWDRILYVNEHAGAVDLVLDPTNPRILYATFWRVRRTPFSLESGGDGSGIWKSTDSGETWTDITRNDGLPKGTVGICGIAVSKTNPDNVYAIVEADDGGVFRSSDAGKTWRRTNQERDLRQRAWYYSRLYADPTDEDVVYVLNVQFHRSKDGGKTFKTVRTPHSDNHDLWIDPNDAQRMIEANDGGANVTTDGGANWSRQDNQPTSQMYRVSVDNAFPYRLLGGQQDNSAVRIRSKPWRGGRIGLRDWEPTAGGESGHIVAKPDEPDVVFGGSYDGYLTMVDHRTGESRTVTVWPDNPMGWGAAELKHRFQWNFPLFFSPHDPKKLYAAAEVLFRSTDLGASWEAMSPDLSTNDKSKQGASGGPITKDNTSVEYYCTIFAALESPHEAGVLWAGTDDGRLHVTRDDGKTWTDVTPKDLPAWSQINSIDAHPAEKGGLYVAATRYKSDDFSPYLYRTTDWGRTWTKITDGIDPTHFTRVVRADPMRAGLLYAGTERGVYHSKDDGTTWSPLQLNLPVVPVTDLAVKENDLVVATQGRGYWILDDLTPLHQVDDVALAPPGHLFAPRRVDRVAASWGRASFDYHLAVSLPEDEDYRVEVSTEGGEVIRTFERKRERDASAASSSSASSSASKNILRRLETDVGHHRLTWDLRHAPAEEFPGLVLWNRGGMRGPKVPPGNYRVRLTIGSWAMTQPLEIRRDPRSRSTDADLVAQSEFLLGVRDKLTETHGAIRRLRALRGPLGDVKKRARKIASSDSAGESSLVATIDAFLDRTRKIEERLYQTKNRARQDPLNFPIRLNDKLSGVASGVSRGDFAPTKQSVAARDELVALIDAALAELNDAMRSELPKINRLVREAGIDPVATDDLPPAPAPIELFNGRDLSGWTAVLPNSNKTMTDVWSVKDGVLVCSGRPRGYLMTKEQYGDYELTVEWRWPGERGGNNGVLVHTTTPDVLAGWPKSLEVQLHAGNAGDFWVIGSEIEVEDAAKRRRPKREGDLHSHRRIPKLSQSRERSIGEWNEMVVRCQGDEVDVWVNGAKMNRGWACTEKKGAVALQSEGTPIEFRRVRLVPLK